MLKAIHAQEDAKDAKEKALQVVEKLRMMRLAKAAEIVENGINETLSYYAMPPEHWRCLRTNNLGQTIIRLYDLVLVPHHYVGNSYWRNLELN